MTMEGCVITLDNPNNTYYPEQTINGVADFTFDKPKKLRGIFVTFRGFAEVKWSSTATTIKRTEIPIINTAEEEYFNITYYLLGSKTGNEIELPAGSHSYPFTCALPPLLPPSFDGEHGIVHYTVKVTLDRPCEFDQDTEMTFTVSSHLDQNMLSEYLQPVHWQMDKTFCCCWCKTGPVAVDVRFPATGYFCGQTIPFDIDCENNSGVTIENIVIELKQYVTYRCRVPYSDRKKTHVVIAEIRLDKIYGKDTMHVQRTLEIPPVPPSSSAKCGIIDVVYKIQVNCIASGCHLDMDKICDITLATAPSVNFLSPPSNDQINNMLPDVPSEPQNPETPLLKEQHDASPYLPQHPPGNPPQNAPYSPQSGMPYPPQNLQESSYPSQEPTSVRSPMNEDNMAPSVPTTDNQPPSNMSNSS